MHLQRSIRHHSGLGITMRSHKNKRAQHTFSSSLLLFGGAGAFSSCEQRWKWNDNTTFFLCHGDTLNEEIHEFFVHAWAIRWDVEGTMYAVVPDDILLHTAVQSPRAPRRFNRQARSFHELD